MISKNSKIYIAGHNGMVGSAIWRVLSAKGYKNLIGKNRGELDLRNTNDVLNFIKTENPDVIIDAAAKVGGILHNSRFGYQFLMENLQIQNNLIDGAFQYNVKNFIFLGSSCIYPKYATQPIKEEYILSGNLEATNQWYAVAKIAGLKACEAIRKQYGLNYVSLMPTNLYGYFDNYDLETSHVLPAMIRKFHEAKINNKSEVILWGSGTPMREFLFVDDLATAVLFCLENQLKDHVYNVGTGKDITIKDLAIIIQRITGFEGKVSWDRTKPDGTPKKLLDVSKINKEGWVYSTELIDGIEKTYKWFRDNISSIKQIKS